MDPIVRLDAAAVHGGVSMAEAIDAVRRGFVELAGGAFEMPVRTVLHGGQFLVMSCAHPASGSLVVKTLSINVERTPSITGTVVRSELARGGSIVADAHAVTTLRTGAAVGVATDLLAAPDASTLVLFGTGAQALDQVRAVSAVRALRRVRVLGRDRPRLDAFVAAVGAEFAELDVAAGADAAVELAGADIVCCATSATAPLFDAAALREQVHVNAIGSFRPSMRELPDDLLAGATVVVDDRAAALAEAGEIIHAIDAGRLRADDLLELGPLLAAADRPVPGRTVFKSVGVAVQDWAVLDRLAQHLAPSP